MKLKYLPPSERPRERLFRKGVSALSHVEILAVLLRTGSGGKDVLELSAELLHVFGDIKGLSRASVSELLKIQGMGRAKVAVLIAAFELAKRLLACDVEASQERKEWEKGIHLLCHALSGEYREFIISLFLDGKGGVISQERVSYGGIDGAFLDVKYLFRQAVRLNAKGMVMVHNHPGGVLKPSREDILLTEYVEQQLELLSIHLVGHFIAVGGEFVKVPSRHTV